MKKLDIRFIAESAIIAALYVALTWLLTPISYGAIQFRISEALILLVALNPKYAYALIIGCFISNTTSPLGWYDMVFGTLATTVAVLPMLKIKRLYVASLFPVVSNAILVSIELGLAFDLFAPSVFWFNVLTIGLGEAVVLYCLGIPLMLVLYKNEMLKEVLELDSSTITKSNGITLPRCLSTLLGALGVIFYFAYPLLERDSLDEVSGFSAFALTTDAFWLISFCLIGFLTIVFGIFTKKIWRFVCNICLWILLLICYIFVGIHFKETKVYPYYYGYCIYIIFYLCVCGYLFYVEVIKKKNQE